MYYVYLLRSRSDNRRTYIGYTTDLKRRMAAHNAGQSIHTRKYVPWELTAYHAFATKQRAVDFERYLKTGSGQAFAKKRFW